MNILEKLKKFLSGLSSNGPKGKRKRHTRAKSAGASRKRPPAQKKARKKTSAVKKSARKPLKKTGLKNKKAPKKKATKKKSASRAESRSKAIKKSVKKSVRTSPVRKKAALKKKTVRKKSAPKRAARLQAKISSSKTAGKYAGEVTHYFDKVRAAVIKLESPLRVRDRIRIDSGEAAFTQTVRSLQINRIPIDEGRKGEEVGLEVKRTVKPGDKVYKI